MRFDRAGILAFWRKSFCHYLASAAFALLAPLV